MISFEQKHMVCLRLTVGLSLLLLSACQQEAKTAEKAESSPLKFEVVDGATYVSAKGQLKYRRAQVLMNSLSKILSMPRQQLCLELGRIPCGDVVHTVSLGGMSAYQNSIYEYPEHVAVTAPISLDRLVLASCTTRASLDIINSKQAVIFKDLTLTPDGRITKDKAFHDSIKTLYNRSLLRDPTGAERQALEQLYVDIYEKEPIGAARNWAVLSCYIVLTGIESIFY